MKCEIPKTQDFRPKRACWAPGSYITKCCICEVAFIGDKLAVNCAPCAYDDAKRAQALSEKLEKFAPTNPYYSKMGKDQLTAIFSRVKERYAPKLGIAPAGIEMPLVVPCSNLFPMTTGAASDIIRNDLIDVVRKLDKRVAELEELVKIQDEQLTEQDAELQKWRFQYMDLQGEENGD